MALLTRDTRRELLEVLAAIPVLDSSAGPLVLPCRLCTGSSARSSTALPSPTAPVTTLTQ